MCDEVNLPIVMIGGGGHASVLTDILLEKGREIVAVISPDDITQRSVFVGLTQLLEDADITKYSPSDVLLVNGIGMMPKSSLREKVGLYFSQLGYRFETVIASTAHVSNFASLAEGSQVLHQAVVQAGAEVGAHSIINTAALIEHDCTIGQHNHIAPRATLCGQVKTHCNVYVGAGSTVIQGIELGKGCIVGAGSTIVKDIGSQVVTFAKQNQETKLIEND
ncbi:sialic acid biosynthesis protein NeuD [Vibrionales bacterium SWAT-3]|nr:sialic acid biosynthesis protein NeuD [Vibrionales bacterium SWAT-3]